MSKIKNILCIKPKMIDLLKTFKKWRKEYIPDTFNQLELLEKILENKIDYGVDITTRSNGKSTNYIGMIGKLAFKYDFRFNIIIDHPYQWESAVQSLKDSARIYQWTENAEEDFWYYNLKTMIKFGVKGKELGYILSINKPADLKKMYALLCDCKINIYDEFIRSDESYYAKEDEYLKEIKETCDKEASLESVRSIFPDGKSRVLLLGNPKNLLNPILSSMGVIKMLEETETNDIIIKKRTAIRLDSNAKTNKKYIDSDFMPYLETETIDNLFKINKHNIISTDELLKMRRMKDCYSVKIKIEEDLALEIVNINKIYVVGITRNTNNCHFTTNLKFKSDELIYLTDDFTDDSYMLPLYEKSFISFESDYSRKEILDSNLYQLNIIKIIGYYKNLIRSTKQEKDIERSKYVKERQYLEQLHRNLFKQIL